MIALPEGPLPIAGYGAAAIPVEILEVWQQKPSAKNNRVVAPSKGGWLQQEDEYVKGGI